VDPGRNVIKLFKAANSQMFVISQSVLSLASLSSLVYCLWARPGAYPRLEHLKWKGLRGMNTLAYYENS